MIHNCWKKVKYTAKENKLILNIQSIPTKSLIEGDLVDLHKIEGTKNQTSKFFNSNIGRIDGDCTKTYAITCNT